MNKASSLQTLALQNSRHLAWHEYGDPQGKPCLYITGTPASGLAGALYDAPARRAGIRWISVDKPGYGHSTYYADRQLLDWPQDVTQLADHLGLSRFACVGESGGGPYVLAMAYALPQRLTLTINLSGMGPGHEPWVRDGMKPSNRRLFWLAQHAPWLLGWAMSSMARSLTDPRKRDRFLEQQLKQQPPADRKVMERHPELMEHMLPSLVDAFREGGRGAAREMAIFARPWGFALSAIRSPVEVWHGTDDVNVPEAVARRVAQEVPGARLRLFEGEGHALFEHADELMARVAGAAA